MRHAAHYLNVLEECDESYFQGGETIKTGLALFDTERQNIEAGQKWACENAVSDKTAARLCTNFAGAYILLLRQHPRERTLWLEAGLATARQLNDRAARH